MYNKPMRESGHYPLGPFRKKNNNNPVVPVIRISIFELF